MLAAEECFVVELDVDEIVEMLLISLFISAAMTLYTPFIADAQPLLDGVLRNEPPPMSSRPQKGEADCDD